MRATSERRAGRLPSVEVDLHDLARGYRFRPPSQAAIARARAAAQRSLDPLLDVGGGPGHHAGAWAAMGRNAVLVDVSPAMTSLARNHEHVRVVGSDAQCLPFRSDTFGLAYFHMSIHYGDWRKSLDEATRVVRDGGRIEIWTFAPADIASSSLARWFPSIADIDQPRFPEPVDIVGHLEDSTTKVELARVDETIQRTASEWEQAVRGRFVSSLQRITPDELEAGIRLFRESYTDDDDVYRYESRFSRVTCVV